MKAWHVLLAISAICAFAFLIMVRDSRRMARNDQVRYDINRLADHIEYYQHAHGRYPSSLNVLISEVDDPEMLETIESILNDAFRDNYEYQISTNGFMITVTGPHSWFYQWETISNHFQGREVK